MNDSSLVRAAAEQMSREPESEEMGRLLFASRHRCWEKWRACCYCGLFLNPTCGTARKDEICVSTLVALMVNTAASPPFRSEPVIMTLLLSDGTITAFPSSLAS